MDILPPDYQLKRAVKRITKTKKENDPEKSPSKIEREHKDLLMIKVIIDIKIRIHQVIDAPKYKVIHTISV